MINNVNINPSMLWHNISGRTSKPQAANSAFSTNTGAPIQLRMDALFSAWMRVPGGGMMSASVFKAENFSAQNPVMLVKGVDVDGTPFEVEINAHDADPRNASFVEMFALDGYFAANGKPSVARAALGFGNLMSAQETAGGNNAFTKFDFMTPLLENLATQRSHGNWEAVARLTNIIGTLGNHISRR